MSETSLRVDHSKGSGANTAEGGMSPQTELWTEHKETRAQPGKASCPAASVGRSGRALTTAVMVAGSCGTAATSAPCPGAVLTKQPSHRC